MNRDIITSLAGLGRLGVWVDQDRQSWQSDRQLVLAATLPGTSN